MNSYLLILLAALGLHIVLGLVILLTGSTHSNLCSTASRYTKIKQKTHTAYIALYLKLSLNGSLDLNDKIHIPQSSIHS